MNLPLLFQWFSLRHLLRDRRSALAALGVALGIAVFISVRVANVTLLDRYRESVNRVSGKTEIEIVGRAGGMDEALVIKLREIPGLDHITPMVQAPLLVNAPSSTGKEPLRLIGVDLLSEGPFREIELSGVSEEAAFEALMDPSAILLPEPWADRHSIRRGDTLEVIWHGAMRPLHVVGLLKGSGFATSHEGNLAIMDIASAQWFLDKIGILDRIDLITDRQIPIEEMIRQIEQRLGTHLMVRRPAQRSAQVEKMLSAFQLNLTALSTLSLFVGIFLIYTTLLISVMQRRREIGILHSLGVSRSALFFLFTLEGIFLGALGGAVGTVMGSFLAQGVLQIVAKTVTSLYLAVTPASLMQMPSVIPPALFLEGIGLGILVATLSALLPALQASHLPPREAMGGIYAAPRPVNPRRLLLATVILWGASFYFSRLPPVNQRPVWGYLAAALLLLSFSLLIPSAMLLFSWLHTRSRLPVAFQIAAGHFIQAMRRNAPTIAAFMGAIAMTISVGIMIASFRQTVLLWIDQTLRADLIVGPPAILAESHDSGNHDESLPSALLQQIQQTPGIEAIDRYRSRRIFFSHGSQPSQGPQPPQRREDDVILVGRDLAVHAAHSQYLFQSGDSKAVIQRAINQRQVLVSEAFANQFHLKEGNWIMLPTPVGETPVEIGGVFYDYSTDGGKLVVDRAFYVDLWKDTGIDVLALYLTQPSAAAALQARFIEMWGDRYTFITENALKEEIMKIFDQTFIITYALEWIAMAIAVLGITNTLFVSVLERQREMGILRTLGASQGQVKQVVLIESVYMGLIGYLLGAICALFLSELIIFVINKQSFGWTLLFYIPPSLLISSFVLTLATSLIAGFLPARQAARRIVSEALAYE